MNEQKIPATENITNLSFTTATARTCIQYAIQASFSHSTRTIFLIATKRFSHSDRKVPELWPPSQQKLLLNSAKTTRPIFNFRLLSDFLTNLTIVNVNFISMGIQHTCNFHHLTDDHRPDYKLDQDQDPYPDPNH